LNQQATIALNAKYTFNLSAMDKIKVGDTFKSVNELRKAVISNYNEKNPSGATKKLIDGTITHFLTHAKVTPNGYKIIITHKKQNVNLTSLQQTQKEKLIFKRHIEILFENFITTQEDVFFLTTSQLIKELKIFHSFYNDYVKTCYDRKYSTRIEINKIEKILLKYGFQNEKDYISDRMEKLQEFVYTSFSKSTIESIAENNGISAIKLWYRGESVVDKYFQVAWENNYINPLLKKGIPPKYITKRANKQYRKDNRISELNHDYIYPVWNFSKNDMDASKAKTANKINSIKKQLNNNFIEKLRRASVDCVGNSYHASNKTALDSLVNSILL